MAPEDLMLGYQQGDAAAFDALYAAFSGRVRGYLLSRLHQPERADEVLQSVFLRLHRARHQYKPGSPFAPWLFTITQSALIDAIRREGRNPARPSAEEPDATLDDLAVTAPAGEDPGLQRLGLLEKLDPANRELLEWRYMNELSFEQIASRLGLSPDSARQRVSRAIRKLRQMGALS